MSNSKTEETTREAWLWEREAAHIYGAVRVWAEENLGLKFTGDEFVLWEFKETAKFVRVKCTTTHNRDRSLKGLAFYFIISRSGLNDASGKSIGTVDGIHYGYDSPENGVHYVYAHYYLKVGFMESGAIHLEKIKYDY